MSIEKGGGELVYFFEMNEKNSCRQLRPSYIDSQELRKSIEKVTNENTSIDA